MASRRESQVSTNTPLWLRCRAKIQSSPGTSDLAYKVWSASITPMRGCPARDRLGALPHQHGSLSIVRGVCRANVRKAAAMSRFAQHESVESHESHAKTRDPGRFNREETLFSIFI
ncbi:hypothetical protein VNO77_03468 [Canavalia gladiata]|uniref:Uncharacterized protein n=1 Tax=Canavalia gladiata TaxID=3824 RepID=A0AAN9MUS9_CANGL